MIQEVTDTNSFENQSISVIKLLVQGLLQAKRDDYSLKERNVQGIRSNLI